MKYDVRINTHGKADPMHHGFFEETAKMVDGNIGECVEYVAPNGVEYRFSKADLDRPGTRPACEKFIRLNKLTRKD